MYPFRYRVSLRIVHPTIDPEEISMRLALQPRTSWKAGNARKTPNGDPLKGRYESSYWTYRISHQPDEDLTDLLEDFTIGLETHRDFLLHLRATSGRLEYFTGWFSGENSGKVFEYDLLSKIASLQIDLSLDIYYEIDE
jgi:Domain of unknown function (DUF4279)